MSATSKQPAHLVELRVMLKRLAEHPEGYLKVGEFRARRTLSDGTTVSFVVRAPTKTSRKRAEREERDRALRSL